MATHSITLPRFDILSDAGRALIDAAGENGARRRALDKALWHLAHGIEILPVAGGFLMPSGTRGGIIHRISSAGHCSCEAHAAGRECWHLAALAIVEQAQMRSIPVQVRIAVARERHAQAMREVEELFA